MKLTLCGSMTSMPAMERIGDVLRAQGHEVELPDPDEAIEARKDASARATKRGDFIRANFEKIDASEVILVVNEPKNGIDGYIGANALLEMGHAYAQGLEIFLLYPVTDLPYQDEVQGMHPIVLNGSVGAIDEYINGLPLVMMSTTSHPKQIAVSRALRRAGLPVRVDGIKVASGVSEQPMAMHEAYEGAMNRHRELVAVAPQADYFCTIESGFESIYETHNPFGCSALIFQKNGNDVVVGAEVNLEFPQEIFDEVPSKYADAGTLIQEKYNSPYKDAYPFLTNDRLTRREILENALYNLIVNNKEGKING